MKQTADGLFSYLLSCIQDGYGFTDLTPCADDLSAAELMNPGELMEFALMEPAVANDVMDTSPTADHLAEDALPEEDDDMTNLPTPEDQQQALKEQLETCKGMKLANINQ
ncbi:hypothetical protein HDU90_005862 [Geranomyces variabilis]|nr:hypothetical protein HDU90_005862 [Geranomyces variabilis]